MKKLNLLIIAGVLLGCSEKSSIDYLTSAKTHITNSSFTAAVIELKNAIKISPELAEARFLLGRIYLESLQYKSAGIEFNSAIEYGYSPSVVLSLLDLDDQTKYTDEALIELSHKHAALTPEQASKIAFYKLQAYIRLDKNIMAEAIVSEIKAFDIKTPFKGLSLAYSMINNGNHEGALLQINKVLEISPIQKEALKSKATLLMTLNKPEKAISVYQQYYNYYPEEHEFALRLAKLLTDNKRTEEAEPIVDKLLHISANHMLLNQLKGLARFNDKDYKNALHHTEKAILLNQSDPALRLVAGYSAYALERYELSHQHILNIVDQLPPAHPALRLLATNQLKLGLHLEANDTLSKFDSSVKEAAILFSDVGLALVKAGEYNKAKKLLSKSVEVSQSAEELTRLAILQLSLNDVSAIANLEQALDKAPQEQITKNTLATAYLSVGKYDEAIKLAKKWKAEDKNDIQGYMLAGLAYFSKKEYIKSKKEFVHILTLDKNNNLVQMELVKIALVNGQGAEAVKLLDNLLLVEPNFVPALSKLFELAKEDNNTDSVTKSIKVHNVINKIEESLKNNPDKMPIKMLYAKVMFIEGKRTKAIGLLESISTDEKLTSVYWELLGKLYFYLGELTKAEKHFKKWLSLEPNNRSTLLSYLNVLDAKKDFEKALVLSSSHIGKNNDDIELQLLHIHFLIKTGDFESAETMFQTLPENVTALAFAKGLKGRLQINDENYKAALVNMKAAYIESSNSSNTRSVYLCLVKLERDELAYEFLENHVNNHEIDLSSLLLLAGLQIKRNVDDAIISYKKFLKLKDNNLVVLNNLATLYLEQKQYEQAKDYAEQALKLEPNNAYVLDTLALILTANKNYEEALVHIQKAVENKNVKESIYLNYVEILLLNKRNLSAKLKIEQRKFKLKSSLEKLARLKSKYKI